MKLFSRFHIFRGIILTILLLFILSSVSFAETSTPLDYVALGDSLAAGVTPNNTIDKSYTDIISEKLDNEGVLGLYKNFGVPGAKTVDVLSLFGNPANISVIKSAEIITLDIGANDLIGAIPQLLANPSSAEGTIQGVVNNIGLIVSNIRAVNPTAKIYVMGYYNAFASYPNEYQASLIPLILGFNTALQYMANYTGVTYVDTYTTIDKHLEKYLPEKNIHPDVSGYRAIAKEFWDVIKIDFLR